MMNKQIYKPSSTDFDKWIQEKVWINGNTKMSRREWLEILVEDTEQWIQNHGYKMNYMWNLKAVATWLYAVQVIAKASSFPNSLRVRYPDPEHRDWEEDYDYFHMFVTYSEISQFLSFWKYSDDLDPTTRWGQRAIHEFGQLLYTFLDLDISENGKKIAKFMESSSSDSDSEIKPKKHGRIEKPETTDTYLQEMKEGSHGGSWSKV